MFSSIEEDSRENVIKSCYWPILKLAEENNTKIGIEASGITLEIIQNIDSSWIIKLKKLINEGKIYFIGSGYSQLIAPLVPWEVNKKNLILGDNIYNELLNLKPTIALLNEQAYSSNLIELYLANNYNALIMEWNNCFDANKNWDSELQYFVQLATNTSKKQNINIIWNNSIAFQKFQRFVHGENDIEEYLDYLKSHLSKDEHKSFPIYGNDAEIFDFRPGRFSHEALLTKESEWERIDNLIKSVIDFDEFKWISAYDLVKGYENTKRNAIILEDINQIIPVKKQRKYNINRWAVTGREDFKINSNCQKIYESIINSKENDKNENWRELCYLWSSDFRTHITEKRWFLFKKRINEMLKIKLRNSDCNQVNFNNQNIQYQSTEFYKDRKYLYVKFNYLEIIFNLKRGLAIEKYFNKSISNEPIFGTLNHGYFEDISWLADWYSGHLTFFCPGQTQVTDLITVEPEIKDLENKFQISCEVITGFGSIYKSWEIDKKNCSLSLSYKLLWEKSRLGSLRIHPITFFPNALDYDSVFIEVKNGGCSKEKYFLEGKDIDHGKQVSFLVSSNQGIGLTDGELLLKDKDKNLKISFERQKSAFVGMLMHKKVENKFFTRVSLSAQEIDDTAKKKLVDLDCKININFNKLSKSK